MERKAERGADGRRAALRVNLDDARRPARRRTVRLDRRRTVRFDRRRTVCLDRRRTVRLD